MAFGAAVHTGEPPSDPGLGWVPSRSSAIKIALIYCLVGSAWIYLSSSLAARAVHETSLLELVERFKGWLFVIVTTLLRATAPIDNSRPPNFDFTS